MLVSIFDFKDYKEYLRAWVKGQPQGGRGAYARIAKTTEVHSSSLSQIIHGEKHFNVDHMVRLSDLLALTAVEKDFLVTLLLFAKAGTEKTRKHWQKKLDELKEKSHDVGERVNPQMKMTEEQKALFYSSWLYPAVHLLTSIPGFSTAALIAQRLNISIEDAERVLNFLLSVGLLVREDGILKMGKASTYLPQTSPLIPRHHQNWRIKALEHHERVDSQLELAYTCPMTLSRSDARKIRAMAVELSEKAFNLAVPSPAEEMYCLNIDWFRVLAPQKITKA